MTRSKGVGRGNAPGARRKANAKRQELLVHGRLYRDADVLMDQFAKRDGLTLMRSARLPATRSHGVFPRWPPARAAGWSGTSPTGRMCHFSFST